MSLTKRWMEEMRDAKRAEEKKTCGCYLDFDLKAEILCAHHAEEAAEQERHYEQGW